MEKGWQGRGGIAPRGERGMDRNTRDDPVLSQTDIEEVRLTDRQMQDPMKWVGEPQAIRHW